MNYAYIAVSLIGFLSLIFLMIGSSLVSKESKKKKEYTAKTTARVKELKEKQIGKPGTPGSIRYYPVYEYRANGQFIRVESTIGTDKPTVKAGDEIEIFYHPERKKEFYIPGSKAPTVVGSVFTILGIITAIAALLVWEIMK